MVDQGFDRPKFIKTIKTGIEQVASASEPQKIIEEGGESRVVNRITQAEIEQRVIRKQHITLSDLRSYLETSKQELEGYKALPEEVKFTLNDGEKNKEQRVNELNEVLSQYQLNELKINNENFAPDEIWDAVIYQTRKDRGEKVDDLPLFKDKSKRSAKIKKHAQEIEQKATLDDKALILTLAKALEEINIDPLSLATEKLKKAISGKDLSHYQNKPGENAASIRNLLVVRKMLQRGEVVNVFMNQTAEGRRGQSGNLKVGEDAQSVLGVSFEEKKKEIKVDKVTGVDQELWREMVNALDDIDALFEGKKDQLSPDKLQGKWRMQGYASWRDEAMLRRTNEIWAEMNKDLQKNLKDQQTWISSLGMTYNVANWLEIPGVGELLTQPELYQPRDLENDMPEKMKFSEVEVEKKLTEKAVELHIPPAKAALAIMLSRLLQTGYYTGYTHSKIRNMPFVKKIEDLGAGLPIITLTPEAERMFKSDEEKAIFYAQTALLNGLVVGELTSYASQHLGRIPDSALEEDLLYIFNVGEAPIYLMPEDKLIEMYSQAQSTDFEEDKMLAEEAFYHREQYRWIFVNMRYSKDWQKHVKIDIYDRSVDKHQKRIGPDAKEYQYLQTYNPEHRAELISFLQSSDNAKMVLKEAGINPDWINDQVMVELFSDRNMFEVNAVREEFFDQIGGKRKIAPSDLKGEVNRVASFREENEDRIKTLAMALEFCLRDKRTWGIDMGKNNSYFASPKLSKEIREKGGFTSDVFNLMLLQEYLRNYQYKTYGEILTETLPYRETVEFYIPKPIHTKMTHAFQETALDATHHPYFTIETGVSLNVKRMWIGYAKGGYWNTTTGMATSVQSQTNLYDSFDDMRLFHGRFHRVIGAHRRILVPRENFMADQIRTANMNRLEMSEVVDEIYEQDFRAKMSNLQSLVEIFPVGSGKGYGMHGTRKLNPDGPRGRLLPNNHPDYLLALEERKAEKFYLEGSHAFKESLEAKAEQGHAGTYDIKESITTMVQFGAMRRWYDNKGEKVGLGDLFSISLEVPVEYYNKVSIKSPWEKVTKEGVREEKHPIEFMVNFGRNVEFMANYFAQTKGYPLGNFFPAAKYGLDASGLGHPETIRRLLISIALSTTGLEGGLRPRLTEYVAGSSEQVRVRLEEYLAGLGKEARKELREQFPTSNEADEKLRTKWEEYVAGSSELARNKLGEHFTGSNEELNAIVREHLAGISEEMRATVNEYIAGSDKDRRERLETYLQGTWADFRKEMIKGWLFDPEIERSEYPTTYWQWRENALGLLGFDSEISLRNPGLVEKGKKFVKRGLGKLVPTILKGEMAAFLEKHKTSMIDKLKKDPVNNLLRSSKWIYGHWLKEDLGDKLKRWGEDGMTRDEKVKIIEAIENHYREGHIDKEFKEQLVQLVTETRDFAIMDIKKKEDLINVKAATLPGFIVDAARPLVKKYFSTIFLDKVSLALNSSPAGYAFAFLSGAGAFVQTWFNSALVQIPASVVRAIPLLGDTLAGIEWAFPLTPLEVGGFLLGIQGAAIFWNNVIRILDKRVFHWTKEDAVIKAIKSMQGYDH